MQKSVGSLASVCLLFKEFLAPNTQKPKFLHKFLYEIVMLLYEIFSLCIFIWFWEMQMNQFQFYYGYDLCKSQLIVL